MEQILKKIIVVSLVMKSTFHPVLLSIACFISTYTVHLNAEHIIFDLGYVLVKPNKWALAYQMGLASCITYLIQERQSIDAIERRAFDILDLLGTQEPQLLNAYHKKRMLPALMCDWLSGTFDGDQVRDKLAIKIQELDAQHYFKSSIEKLIIERVFTCMFDAETLTAHTDIMAGSIALLEKLKATGRHTFYILSNWSLDSFALLYKRPAMASLFSFFAPEHIMISGAMHDMKPHTSIFRSFLAHHNLDPRACIFIDDQIENVIASQAVGIPSLQFKNHSQLMKDLRKYDII